MRDGRYECGRQRERADGDVRAVARAVATYEPEYIGVLAGGHSKEVVAALASMGCLRPETLRPLLLSDALSSSAEAVPITPQLASVAPHSRGLAAVAAQRLNFEARRREQQQQRQSGMLDALDFDECADLPFGTRRAGVGDNAAR